MSKPWQKHLGCVELALISYSFIHSYIHLKFDYVSSSDHDQVTPSAYFVTLISLANGLGRVTAGIEIYTYSIFNMKIQKLL